MIYLTRPSIRKEAALGAIGAVLESQHLTEGGITRNFERSMENYVGMDYGVAVSNATVGLELALKAAKVRPRDRVIIPAFTHPATVLAVKNIGATPILVDVTLPLGIIDYRQAIRAAWRYFPRAIIPVSLFGHPINYTPLLPIFREVCPIEDAACGLGARCNDIHTGVRADMMVLSFHPRKILTTGEGGMILTHDRHFAEFVEAQKNFGINTMSTGTNAKLSDINSALGLTQVDRLPDVIRERRALAEVYNRAFFCDTAIMTPTEEIGCFHTYQTYCILVHNRDKIKEQLWEQGIETQVGSYNLCKQPRFKGCIIPEALPNADVMGKRSLALPLYPGMSQEDQDTVIRAVLKLTRGA